MVKMWILLMSTYELLNLMTVWSTLVSGSFNTLAMLPSVAYTYFPCSEYGREGWHSLRYGLLILIHRTFGGGASSGHECNLQTKPLDHFVSAFVLALTIICPENVRCCTQTCSVREGQHAQHSEHSVHDV